MAVPAKELYLDLLERSISYTLWEEPPVPLELHWCARGWLKRGLARWLTGLAGAAGIIPCVPARYSKAQREGGQIWPLQAHSMIGLKRMGNLRRCVETALVEGVPGDLIETGVWRGGACIFMKGILAAHGDTERKVYVADSFRGLPKPDETQYPEDKGDKLYQRSFLAISRREVEDNFRKYGLLDARVIFLEGWFKDTLPKLPDQPFAVIRLDGDLYESTTDALRALYPRLSPGGFCIIDDYMLRTCSTAVHDYRQAQGIAEPIQDIDGVGAFWRKARA